MRKIPDFLKEYDGGWVGKGKEVWREINEIEMEKLKK